MVARYIHQTFNIVDDHPSVCDIKLLCQNSYGNSQLHKQRKVVEKIMSNPTETYFFFLDKLQNFTDGMEIRPSLKHLCLCDEKPTKCH